MLILDQKGSDLLENPYEMESTKKVIFGSFLAPKGSKKRYFFTKKCKKVLKFTVFLKIGSKSISLGITIDLEPKTAVFCWKKVLFFDGDIFCSKKETFLKKVYFLLSFATHFNRDSPVKWALL